MRHRARRRRVVGDVLAERQLAVGAGIARTTNCSMSTIESRAFPRALASAGVHQCGHCLRVEPPPVSSKPWVSSWPMRTPPRHGDRRIRAARRRGGCRMPGEGDRSGSRYSPSSPSAACQPRRRVGEPADLATSGRSAAQHATGLPNASVREIRRRRPAIIGVADAFLGTASLSRAAPAWSPRSSRPRFRCHGAAPPSCPIIAAVSVRLRPVTSL